jgi:DNA-binding transcriptional LysR family regulator
VLRFTLRQLEYALAVAEAGSVARASEKLGIAQPTMSAAVAKLEEQIGLQIFIRHHAQGVSPTPAGTRFLSEARNLVNHANDMQRDTAAAGTAIEGELSIGSFMTIAAAQAPRLIAGFREKHPAVSLRLEEGTQGQLFEGLNAGRYDLVLLYVFNLPGDLAVTHLFSKRPYLLLPEKHRLAHRREIDLHALAGDPLILLDVQPSREYFMSILTVAGIEPKIAFSSPSLEVVRGLVGQGLGYSILITRPHADVTYDGHKLAVREIAGDVECGHIAIARLQRVRKTKLHQAFEDHCKEAFGTQPAR